MTLADRIIDSLSAHHDRLAAVVADADDQTLAAVSGATQWRISDVLSHLGSGSEIMLSPIRRALGEDVPPVDNQVIWSRWNASTPREQAEGYVRHNGALVETLRGLSAEQRGSLQIDLGFLPEPAPLDVAAGMRLNEVALHSWDVFAGLDPTAVIDSDTADLLFELYTGPLSFMTRWTGRADALAEPAIVDFAGHGLSIQDAVALTVERPAGPTATFTAAPEAAVRLMAGRLRPEFTPGDVVVEGNVTLDDLRRVFPGF